MKDLNVPDGLYILTDTSVEEPVLGWVQTLPSGRVFKALEVDSEWEIPLVEIRDDVTLIPMKLTAVLPIEQQPATTIAELGPMVKQWLLAESVDEVSLDPEPEEEVL